MFLELGPHPALAGPITDSVGVLGKEIARYFVRLTAKKAKYKLFLRNLARLHIEGVQVELGFN